MVNIINYRDSTGELVPFNDKDVPKADQIWKELGYASMEEFAQHQQEDPRVYWDAKCSRNRIEDVLAASSDPSSPYNPRWPFSDN